MQILCQNFVKIYRFSPTTSYILLYQLRETGNAALAVVGSGVFDAQLVILYLYIKQRVGLVRRRWRLMRRWRA